MRLNNYSYCIFPGKVLSCEQDGYSYTEVEVEVAVLDGEDSSANVVL